MVLLNMLLQTKKSRQPEPLFSKSAGEHTVFTKNMALHKHAQWFFVEFAAIILCMQGFHLFIYFTCKVWRTDQNKFQALTLRQLQPRLSLIKVCRKS